MRSAFTKFAGGCAAIALLATPVLAEKASQLTDINGSLGRDVRLVSIPMGEANTGMGESTPGTGDEDALVAGTQYDATTTLPCGFDGAAPARTCEAGVKRNWGEDGTNLVEVTKPDGRKRAIFFNGTEPYSADSAQSDGSAGWDFETQRDGDRVTIVYGPETYVVVDALITGG